MIYKLCCLACDALHARIAADVQKVSVAVRLVVSYLRTYTRCAKPTTHLDRRSNCEKCATAEAWNATDCHHLHQWKLTLCVGLCMAFLLMPSKLSKQQRKKIKFKLDKQQMFYFSLSLKLLFCIGVSVKLINSYEWCWAAMKKAWIENFLEFSDLPYFECMSLSG